MPRLAMSGAIAVGKSTITRNLAEASSKMVAHEEDVHELRFLSRFYANPQRFAFHSRIEFLAVKARELKKSSSTANAFVVLDRVLPELITFANAMRKSGTMTEDEYLLYRDVYRILNEALPKFDAFIWVRCETQECLRRIALRGRSFEQSITADYLAGLDHEYELWFREISAVYPALMIDTTEKTSDVEKTILAWLDGIGFPYLDETMS